MGLDWIEKGALEILIYLEVSEFVIKPGTLKLDMQHIYISILSLNLKDSSSITVSGRAWVGVGRRVCQIRYPEVEDETG